MLRDKIDLSIYINIFFISIIFGIVFYFIKNNIIFSLFICLITFLLYFLLIYYALKELIKKNKTNLLLIEVSYKILELLKNDVSIDEAIKIAFKDKSIGKNKEEITLENLKYQKTILKSHYFDEFTLIFSENDVGIITNKLLLLINLVIENNSYIVSLYNKEKENIAKFFMAQYFINILFLGLLYIFKNINGISNIETIVLFAFFVILVLSVIEVLMCLKKSFIYKWRKK